MMTNADWFWIFVAVGALGAMGAGLFNSLSKLSPNQIATYASNAGFNGNALPIAVAIALAESNGNPNAHGDMDKGSGTGSFGLWQIYSDAHPEFGPNFALLYNPQSNANAAYSVYVQAGYSFTPWTTYNSGLYLQYM
jgi:hypothetical protein